MEDNENINMKCNITVSLDGEKKTGCTFLEIEVSQVYKNFSHGFSLLSFIEEHFCQNSWLIFHCNLII